MEPGDTHWHSRVEAPLRRTQGAPAQWAGRADVVIIGLGCAGVCAALEALEAGASVIAIDRFTGGGATRMSGGVFYAGGGTSYQRAAGIADDPDNMFRYLKQEVGDAVADATLRRFCETSAEQVAWLERHGVRFGAAVAPIKTSYPPDGYYLYYSGNEAQAGYARQARPAQRGHRTFGKGLTGHLFFDALLAAALSRGLKLHSFSEARRFLLSDAGEIEGIEIRQVDPDSGAARELERISRKFGKPTTLLFPRIAERLKARASAILDEHGVLRSIGINKAAVLTTGGFIHNRAMVDHYAPRYSGAIALGSIGCDGSGIRLGQTLGARAERLDAVSAWRQFQPPAAFATGIVVDGNGDRFIAEDCYGGTVGHAIAEKAGGKAYIVIDRKLRAQALRQAMPGRNKLFRLQGAPALMGLFLSSTKSRSLRGLADKCGMVPERLEASVTHYNRASAGIEKPRFPKHADFTGRITTPPFYAIDIAIDNKRYLCPSISLGGLSVDEATGQVLDGANEPIARLFAAGKTAKGISSHRYVSGISLADCVFSGRTAGRSAALTSSARDSGQPPSSHAIS